MKITKFSASMILDSKGRPTIRVDLKTDGIETSSCAPSGTSVGKFEAQAFPKEGVEKAVAIANREIGKQLTELEIHGLKEVDDKLRSIDGTSNFSKIGGNTAIAVSTVVAKALANIEGKMLCEYLCENGKMSLPFPLSNVIGGGRHTVGDTLDFQEFLVIPTGAKNFAEAAMFNVQVHKEVGNSIIEKHSGYVLGRNDEGAWAAPLRIDEALTLLSSAIEKVGNTTGIEGKIGIDLAASELWDGRRYEYKKEKRFLDANEQLSYISKLTEKYDITYLEDPLEEEDFDGFARLNETLGERLLVVGDDLIVTNPKRLQNAIDKQSINGAIIKPNQIGTLTDVRTTVNMAKRSRIVPVASHRSGETSDTALAHIAVGLKCRVIKIGISGGERLEKINELMKIERTIKPPMAKIR
nr:enolase C-terminal domain-like protein [Candidatus Njordarchaeum guaymaensis]